MMIVRDMMTTKIVTVEPDDTLAHAVGLLRQHGFHHLPVVRTVKMASPQTTAYVVRQTRTIFEGLVTSQDIDLAIALTRQESSSEVLHQPWQEQRVAEVMQPAPLRVTPTTSIAGAAQLLISRGFDSLPVVEYGQDEQESQAFLVGLITRSDLLRALARALGAFEPGMQLEVKVVAGNMLPLAETLRIVAELHIPLRSLIVAPLEDGVPHMASLRLGTINPSPLLLHLRQAKIEYVCVDPSLEGETYA